MTEQFLSEFREMALQLHCTHNDRPREHPLIMNDWKACRYNFCKDRYAMLEVARGTHPYAKMTGFGPQFECCATCWKGGDGKYLGADDPIHQVAKFEARLALADRLIDLYRRNQAGVAKVIDEQLDLTGNTLGYLREAAQHSGVPFHLDNPAASLAPTD